MFLLSHYDFNRHAVTLSVPLPEKKKSHDTHNLYIWAALRQTLLSADIRADTLSVSLPSVASDML